MAKKSGNGQDPATAQMVKLLERIADRLDSVDEQLEGVRSDIRDLRGDVQDLKGRVDNLIELAGAGYRRHEDRIAKLEERLDRLELRK